MNKKDLVGAAVDILKGNNIRKTIPTQKTVLHVTDDFGNKKDFTIRKTSTGILFTSKDVESILDALLLATTESLKTGGDVSIHGFGSLGLHLRAARKTKHPTTKEDIVIEERFSPKFDFGNELRRAAKIYEQSQNSNVGDDNVIRG